jgi:hypothetical protein
MNGAERLMIFFRILLYIILPRGGRSKNNQGGRRKSASEDVPAADENAPPNHLRDINIIAPRSIRRFQLSCERLLPFVCSDGGN